MIGSALFPLYVAKERYVPEDVFESLVREAHLSHYARDISNSVNSDAGDVGLWH